MFLVIEQSLKAYQSVFYAYMISLSKIICIIKVNILTKDPAYSFPLSETEGVHIMKNIPFLFVLLVLLIPVLSACSTHSGNVRVTDQSVIDKIKIGQTTKEEVQSIMGNPTSIMKTGAAEKWDYTYQKTNIGAKAFIPFAALSGKSAVGIEYSNATISFDKNGIVADVSSTTSGR